MIGTCPRLPINASSPRPSAARLVPIWAWRLQRQKCCCVSSAVASLHLSLSSRTSPNFPPLSVLDTLTAANFSAIPDISPIEDPGRQFRETITRCRPAPLTAGRDGPDAPAAPRAIPRSAIIIIPRPRQEQVVLTSAVLRPAPVHPLPGARHRLRLPIPGRRRRRHRPAHRPASDPRSLWAAGPQVTSPSHASFCRAHGHLSELFRHFYPEK